MITHAPLRGLLAAVTLALTLAAQAQIKPPPEVEVFAVKSGYGEAKALLEAAIEGRGLKIDRVSRVGEMLERTGPDVGGTKQVYENAEVFEFCSATLSRRMMETNPHNMVHCPYVISVYALAGQKNASYYAIRKLPSRPETDPVLKLLREIAREAAK